MNISSTSFCQISQYSIKIFSFLMNKCFDVVIGVNIIFMFVNIFLVNTCIICFCLCFYLMNVIFCIFVLRTWIIFCFKFINIYTLSIFIITLVIYSVSIWICMRAFIYILNKLRAYWLPNWFVNIINFKKIDE